MMKTVLLRLWQVVDALMFYVMTPAASLMCMYMGASLLIDPPSDEYGFVTIMDSTGFRVVLLMGGIAILAGWCLMAAMRKRTRALQDEVRRTGKGR